jgi:hypothetical protein
MGRISAQYLPVHINQKVKVFLKEAVEAIRL